MNHISSGYDIKNLQFSYGSDSCLKDLSLQLEPGLFYGLIGPNGSGKSTLLDLMCGFLTPSTGTISLNLKDVGAYSRRSLAHILSSVPQSFSLNFDYTVNDVVLMGRYPYIGRFSHPDESDAECVKNALQLMDVFHLRDRLVRKLSGGEKQRVIIARALAQDTPFILFDEVTSNLDINHAISIMKTMSRLVSQSNRTIIAALHDLNMALAFCDRLIVMKEGRLEHYGVTADIISEEMIMNLYQVRSVLSGTGGRNNHIRYTYQ